MARCHHCGWDALDAQGNAKSNKNGDLLGSHHPECKHGRREREEAFQVAASAHEVDKEVASVLAQADAIRARQKSAKS
jgi:hypothetical protein